LHRFKSDQTNKSSSLGVRMRKHNFADVVEEEKVEEDGTEHLRRRQARFKMVKDKDEFGENKEKVKRNRSTDFVNKDHNTLIHDFGDVSENEEEELQSESSRGNKKQEKDKKNKTYSIGHITRKIWSRKIYSDDFDADFDLLKKNQILRFKLGSVQNSAIQEDNERSEIENPYFSDNSQSS
jgi:hypothetical protein